MLQALKTIKAANKKPQEPHYKTIFISLIGHNLVKNKTNEIK